MNGKEYDKRHYRAINKVYLACNFVYITVLKSLKKSFSEGFANLVLDLV